ncbi:Plasma membrane t-SNARE, secretory vesicle fusion [Gaertneriomyces sp. JEL0708]|nr:Plasma membrane t-SNARE, secretory vesicle fusion [Gaertneriomyces sp. JEL0708]
MFSPSDPEPVRDGDFLSEVELESIRTLTGTGLDRFLHRAEAVADDIAHISRNVQDLQLLHQDALQEINLHQQRALTARVDALTDSTRTLLHRTRQEVKDLSTLPASTKADAQVQAIQQKALAAKLLKTAREFQNVQKTAGEAYRHAIARQYKIAKPNATREEIDAAMEDSTVDALNVFQHELLAAKTNVQRTALREVEGRREELARIEQSVTEMFTLFQDMQVLLDAQQDQITTIDQYVESTDMNVQAGSSEMTAAIRHAKSARRMKWIVFWVVVVILLVVAIAVSLSVTLGRGGGGGGSGGGGETPPPPSQPS